MLITLVFINIILVLIAVVLLSQYKITRQLQEDILTLKCKAEIKSSLANNITKQLNHMKQLLEKIKNNQDVQIEEEA